MERDADHATQSEADTSMSVRLIREQFSESHSKNIFSHVHPWNADVHCAIISVPL